MYIIGQDIIDETRVPQSALYDTPLPYYRWKVEIEGINLWHINGFNCPIKSGQATDTKNGLGKASLDFAILDKPITSQDRVNIYYNAKKIYTGYVDKIPDPSGGKISISPDSKKFDSALYNADYTSTNVTFQTIIQESLNEKQDQVDVLYNESLIDIDDTSVKSIKYNYQSLKTVFRDIVDQLDDRYAGNDSNQFYYIKKFSTTVKYKLFNNDNPPFRDLETSEDDTKIKATRYQVYQKSGSESIYIGQVGYDTSTGDYPILSIENRIGIKESKYSAPEGLSSSDALTFAYTQLQSEAIVPKNIKITGLDLRRIPIEIGDRIRTYKPETLLWRTIIDCESTAGWIGDLNLSTIAKVDSYSIAYSGLGGFYYQYPSLKKWNKIKKIGFYIRSDTPGNHVSIHISNYAQTHSYSNYSAGNYSYGGSTGTEEMNSTYFNVHIRNVNQWNWVDQDITLDDFRYISFITTDSDANIWIDEIKLYQYHQQIDEGNVIQIDYTLGSDYVNIQAGDYKQSVNDDFFRLNKEVKKQQEILEA